MTFGVTVNAIDAPKAPTRNKPDASAEQLRNKFIALVEGVFFLAAVIAYGAILAALLWRGAIDGQPRPLWEFVLPAVVIVTAAFAAWLFIISYSDRYAKQLADEARDPK